MLATECLASEGIHCAESIVRLIYGQVCLMWELPGRREARFMCLDLMDVVCLCCCDVLDFP